MTRVELTHPEQVLKIAGYDPHKNGSHLGGFVRWVSEKDRWHAYVKGNVIELHFDKTIKGYHNSKPRIKWEKIETKRLTYFHSRHFCPRPSKKEKVDKNVYAPNLMQIQRRKVIVRPWWNPLRYFKGKLIYVQSPTYPLD